LRERSTAINDFTHQKKQPMKKITRIFGLAVFCTFLGLTQPTYAQNGSGSAGTSQTTSDRDDDDDNGKWGLAGLLGLLGLLGLKKRDDDRDRRTTTGVTR
jgi:hypothetical protein